MNYAALLAVLAVLAFAFPVLVRVARAQGVPQSWSVVAAILGAVFALAWVLIRQRVKRYRDATERAERIRAQLAITPNTPEAFFDGGEHLGDVLMRMNRKHEALEVWERYLLLERSRGKDLKALEAQIEALKLQLGG